MGRRKLSATSVAESATAEPVNLDAIPFVPLDRTLVADRGREVAAFHAISLDPRVIAESERARARGRSEYEDDGRARASLVRRSVRADFERFGHTPRTSQTPEPDDATVDTEAPF